MSTLYKGELHRRSKYWKTLIIRQKSYLQCTQIPQFICTAEDWTLKAFSIILSHFAWVWVGSFIKPSKRLSSKMYSSESSVSAFAKRFIQEQISSCSPDFFLYFEVFESITNHTVKLIRWDVTFKFTKCRRKRQSSKIRRVSRMFSIFSRHTHPFAHILLANKMLSKWWSPNCCHLLSLSQTRKFRLFQTERVCRWKF